MNKGLQSKGVFAASLTPMKDDLTVDHDRLAAHCKWLLANGCDGLALMGTTGEANSLSVAERMILLDAVVDAGVAPERLIVGTGCCALPDTLSLTQHAAAYGVRGVLLLPPFYYKGITDDGVFASVDAVIQQLGNISVRVYLYHFPQMTTIPFTDAVIERLLRRYPEVMVGVKDSSGDWDHMRHLVKSFPSLQVFAGNERFLLDILRAGGAGCISASLNITCQLAAQVYKYWPDEESEPLQERLSRARLAIQSRPMIPALKGLMARHMGERRWTNIRPPLLPLPDKEIDRLLAELKEPSIEAIESDIS